MPFLKTITKPGAHIAIVLFIAANVIGWLTPIKGFDGECWTWWTIHIHKWGLGLAYHSGTDYPPFYLYILRVYGSVLGSEEKIRACITGIKSITLAFDLLGLWYVYKWIDERVDFSLLVIVSLLNLGYSYNTVIWGQVDGIAASLSFVAIYYAVRQKTILSTIWFMLAINMKLQSIIFLPVWGIISLFNAIEKKSFGLIGRQLLIMIVLQFILVLPFLFDAWEREALYHAIVNSAGRYPFMSYGAFNFWHFFFSDPFHTRDNMQVAGGLTYNKAGLLLFLIASTIVLFPLLKNFYQKVKQPETELVSKEKLWLMCTLIPLVFFYFNTQMHERYCHPAFIFLAAYSFYSRDFIPYVLMSVAYFLNLEEINKWLNLFNYDTLIFDSRFIAAIYGVLIVYLLYLLYKIPNSGGKPAKAYIS